MRILLLALVVVAVSFAPAYAISDLSGYFTSDNWYDLYLSTDDSQLGTLIGSSDGSNVEPWDWETSEPYNFSLNAGATNYLHVVAKDDGYVIAGVLGNFTLNNPNFLFSNGTSSLLTNTTDWKVYDNYGGNLLGIVNAGGYQNGQGPWAAHLGGPIPNISTNARWLWTNGDNKLDLGQTRYFSAAINAVPEPISTILFVSGGTVLLIRRLRRK
jgi:hypothetical protein